MNNILRAEGLCKAYGKKEVLHSIDLAIEEGKIYGLIGRNGAGKTTLLSILTAQNTHSKGSVTYGGEKVWENNKAISNLCFSRELSTTLLMGQNTLKVKEYLRAAACYYPSWDKEMAKALLEKFDVDKKKAICKLSKGMLSMVTIVIALASKAPITILDEPVAGLDVVAREMFYKILIDEYIDTKRTFIISTHIIEEAANVFEEIIFMDEGKIIEKANTEEFLTQFCYVSGKDADVDEVAKGFTVLHQESIGRSKTVCLRGKHSDIEQAASGKDVDLTPVSLQKAFVHLTSGDKGGAVSA